VIQRNSSTTVIFNQLPQLPLPKGNIWVGDSLGYADSVAPGANGTVLRIVNGIPTWVNSNNLYVFNNGVELNGDSVQLGGNLVKNTNLDLQNFNLTIGNAGQTGTTRFETGVNLGDGTNTNVPLSTRGSAGTDGQVLISRGAGSSPEYVDTLNNFVLNNSTFNTSTLNNTTLNNTTTVNGPTTFNNTVLHNDKVTFGDTAEFNTTVIFNQLPQLPLPKGNIWVGDSLGYADSVAPGANGTVLRIVNGIPTWVNSNNLYVFNNGVELNGDSVQLGGNLVKNTNLDLQNFNLTIGNAGQTGTTRFETGINLGDGTNTNVPLSTRGSAGTDGQVLISRGAGSSPEYVDTLNNFVLNSSTLNNTTLNNTTTVNGPTTFNNIVLHNDKVTFGDTAEFNSKVIFNQLPQLPLPKGNIWVGDSLGYADSVAPGANGTVLRIVNGNPTWVNSNNLYVFNNGVELNGDSVQLGGNLVKNTNLDLQNFNLTIGNAGQTGTTRFETGVNLGDGTNTNVPLSTRGSAGTDGQVLISRGAGSSPEYVDTLNNFVLNNSTFNTSTLNNTTLNNTTTVNGPTTFNNTVLHNDKVTFGDTAEFNSKVIFNQLPQLPLPKGNIWVGDSLGYADSVAPGANGTVLRIVNGIPTWVNSNNLYVFNNGVELNGDSVQLGGNLVKNTNLDLQNFNLTIGNAGQTGTTRFETGVNLGDGTNTNVPLSTRGSAGTDGQVLISRGAGSSPEYVDTLNNFVLNNSTFNTSTLNNTTLNNTTTVNGPTTFNNTVLHNDKVTFGDTAEFNSKVIFNQLPQLPLPKGNIWVGDSLGYADSVAPGANGTVLRIVNGIPTWVNSNNLYVFNNGVELNGDSVQLGGNLVKNTNLDLQNFNLTIGNAGQTGTTRFETGVNLGDGTNTNVPLSTRGSAGTDGQVLISRGAGSSPEYVDTLNNFVLNNSTFNTSTLNNTTLNNTTTVNGPTTFNNTVLHNDKVTFGDTAEFNSKVIFNQLPQLPLPKGNIWVGDSLGYADSVAPGANGTVLRIVNGIPTWVNSNNLYVFNNGVELNGDSVQLGGNLVKNTNLDLQNFNLTIGNAGQTGTTRFETGVNLGDGTNTNVPLSTRGSAGTDGQVLISRGAGSSPEYVDTLNNFVLNNSTFNTSTLNNTTLNNTTTVNGPTTFNNTVLHNDKVTFGDTAEFNSKVIFNQLPQLPLPKGNIWVGDSLGYADSVAPGANGTVLRIVNGIPTWVNSNNLYVFNNGVELNGDSVQLGGNLVKNTNLDLQNFNLTIGNAGQTGTTRFETGVNLGDGTNTNVPLSTRGSAGTDGQVLISRGAGSSPEYVDTLNNFVLNSSTLNNTTLNNTTTVNGPTTFNNIVLHNDKVTFGDTAEFNSKVIFNQLPQLPLPKGNIWVGDSLGYADSVAPGANGTVLRIVNGIPTWVNSNNLYVFNNGVELNGDSVQLGGNLVKNTNLDLQNFNLTIGNAGQTGTTRFETGVNLGDGTNTNVPLSTRGSAGTDGQVLISRGAGSSPEYVDTLNNFVLNNSTFNTSTLNNTTLNNTTTVNGPTTFNNTVLHNDKVTFGDTAEFNSKVIFNQLPQLPLPKGNIWVGDSLGYADSVAPGANGTVLRIVNGIPTWVNSNNLYVFNNGVELNGDSVQLGGNLVKNTNLDLQNFNLTIGNAGQTGTTRFETGVNLGDGTNTNVPLSTRGSAGTDGQVLISRGAGSSPEYVDTLNNFVMNNSTFNTSTLNNTTLNNTTTVNGPTTFNNTVLHNDKVTFGDTAEFNTTVIFNQLPQLPLPKGNIWVGDSLGYADSVAPGANGSVLRIVSGIPTWQSGTGLYSFHNGISLSSDSVTLGGNFIKNTTLGLGTYNLTIGNAGQTGTTRFETGINLGDGTNTNVPLSTRGSAGTDGQVLISRGAGSSPEYVDTLNNFVMNNSTFNTSTLNNTTLNNTTTVNGPTTFNNTVLHNDKVTFGDTAEFNSKVIFNQLPQLPLPKGNIWVGDSLGYADSVAPGANGSVLRIVNGIPTWQSGTGLYSFHNGISLSSDSVTLGGNFIKNTTLGLGTYNLTIGNAGQTGTTRFETGINLGDGTNTNVPLSTRGSAGTDGQVLISRGAGSSPEYVDTLNNFVMNNSTFNTSTLNNTTLNNTTTVNGPTTFNNTVLHNDKVTFGDTAEFNSKVIFNQLPQLPLPKGNIWVGDSLGYADSVAPGANGSVLRIVSGIPTWQSGTGIYSFYNGISLNGDSVTLGGNFIKNTTLGLGTYNLTIGNAGQTGTTSFETGINLGDSTNTSVPLRTRGNDGNADQILIGMGAGNSPRWVDTLSNKYLSNFTLTGANTTINSTSVTFNNGTTTTFNGNTIFNSQLTVNNNATFNNTVNFDSTVTFAQIPIFPLKKGQIIYGDTTDMADTLAPGANNTVLKIQAGLPTWVPSTGLYQFANGVSLSNDTVMFGGTPLIKNTTLSVANYNLTIGAAGNVGNVIFGTGLNLGSATDTNAALNTRGSDGSFGDVMISHGANNSPLWTNTLANLTINNSTVNTSTINNSTASNTTLTGNTTVNGPTVFNSTVNTTDKVTFGDTAQFNSVAIFNQLPQLPLQQNAILVGNALNIAAQYNSTNQPGYVLAQDNTGKPIWRSLDTLTEDWKVGGNANPTSTVFGNTNPTGGIKVVAGNQDRINISGTSANVTLPGNGLTPTSLTFNNTANTFGTTISSTPGQAANINYTLPPTQGNANAILQNDGAGNLTWNNPSPGATFVSVYKGKVILTPDAKTVTISGSMPALNQNSVITIGFETSGTPCTITAYVSQITDGTSFVVQFSGAVPNGAKLSYIVIP
jgi:formylmethanofuran:tetrahydromethanopterin formyltransferase